MHATRPSSTASLVACMRALATDGFTTAKGFQDPIAAKLLPLRWQIAREFMRRAMTRMAPAERERAGQQIDVVALRMLALDESLRAALDAGIRQVVILGAGLDSRAFRLEALKDATLWEVDHPHTQAWKREAVQGLRPMAKALHFVPVNFEKDALSEKLKDAGFRPDEPTVWLWEGVVMYLTDAALRATLNAISALSAPGSQLLLHYHQPSGPGPYFKAMNALLSFWREPQIGNRTPAQISDEIVRAGLVVVEDSGHADWARKYGAQVPGELGRRSRMAVARKG